MRSTFLISNITYNLCGRYQVLLFSQIIAKEIKKYERKSILKIRIKKKNREALMCDTTRNDD